MKVELPFRSRVVVGILGTVLTPVLVVGLSLLIALGVAGLPGDAAFRANGTVVTKTALKHRQDVLKALYGIAPPPDAAGQDAFRRQSAEAIVLTTVLDRAAQERGIVIPEKDARDSLMQLIGTRFPGGMTQFAQLLGTVGASEQDVVDEIKRQKASSKLFDSVTGGKAPANSVTEAAARRFYDENPANFREPETRRIRNIVVPSEKDGNQVLAQARSGADFAGLASSTSLDRSTSDAGGDLGFVARDQFEQAYAQQAFDAPVGGVFGPVKTEHGWNVGQVLELHPAVMPSFDQVKEQLRSELASRNTLDRWRSWVADRVRDADVEYADEYRPAHLSTPPQARALAPAGTGQEVPR